MNADLTISNLHQLLDYDAGKFTRAEVQLKNHLPEWIRSAGSLHLKQVMQQYLALVERHIGKMESFFEEEKISSMSVPGRVMQAFISETNEMLSRCTQFDVKDVCLLASLQDVIHFKISTYGTAAAFANTLGMHKIAEVFHEAEINEKYIDGLLSELAEHEINIKAKSPIVLSK